MRHKHGKRHGLAWYLLLLCGIAAVLVLLYQGGRWLETRNAQPQTRGDPTQRYAYEESIQVDGVSYRKRRNLTSILLMGIDQESGTVAGSYRNGGQADFLRLVVIDGAADHVTQLAIDRDTMTPITILGVLGNQSGVRTAQLCLSHGFGDGKEQSCQLTADAVSNLLLGAQIDFYLAMNLDGISVLNDWAGGVTVTLADDFSALDPTMTAGRTLTLQGDQAEIYVRERRSVGVGTNEARMERQQEYVELLSQQLIEKMGQSQETVGQLYDALSPYLVTDMSRGRLINEIWAAKDYPSQAISLAGEHQIGTDGFMQFLVDQDALEQTVLELFYEKV